MAKKINDIIKYEPEIENLLSESIFLLHAEGYKKSDIIKSLSISNGEYNKAIQTPEYVSLAEQELKLTSFNADVKRLKKITEEGGILDKLAIIIEDTILPSIENDPTTVSMGVANILNNFIRSADSLSSRISELQINIQNNVNTQKQTEKDILITGNESIDNLVDKLDKEDVAMFFKELSDIFNKYENRSNSIRI